MIVNFVIGAALIANASIDDSSPESHFRGIAFICPITFWLCLVPWKFEKNVKERKKEKNYKKRKSEVK